MSIRLSREKINFLSRQILDGLFENDQVEFLDEPNEIRLTIVKSIEDEMKLYEGSREWEILYRKYVNEEFAKLGKFFT